MNFRNSLPGVSEISLPRWTGHTNQRDLHLYGFSDASKRAYSAVIYAVIPGSHSIILMAKSKVAPVKVETLPRLELCGAVLLTRLARHVVTGSHPGPCTINFWTDSRIVLDWLKSHPSRWPTFIANRTSEIMTSFPAAKWRHVRSADNPADCATRGLAPKELAHFSLWWTGPPWMLEDEAKWPSIDDFTTPADASSLTPMVEEECIHVHAQSNQELDCLPSLHKYSNFSKIIRILAYICRWRLRPKPTTNRSVDWISAAEWKPARPMLFRAIQFRHFQSELINLTNKGSISTSSSLARLSPFLCPQGLIRVGGRLQNAHIPYDEKHPIILPGKSIFVLRMVEEVHHTTLHGGIQLMLSQLNRLFWIIPGKRLITRVYRTCVKCNRFGAKPLSQQMAPLPAYRLTPQRVFTSVGMDYAGPFDILFSRGRGAKTTKGYVLIFICMVVKATHIEIVSDLTTQAFLAAFSRFTARRGQCATVYSDNGTTFKGAAAELRSLFAQRSSFSAEIAEVLAQKGIDWCFIPPRAPHFGGLWESAVRCFKNHLKKVIGDSKLTYEEMSTLAAKVEACLNSRPICPLSQEASSLVALTPGHFLTGTSLLSLPEPLQDGNPRSTFKSRWEMIAHMHQTFWSRWRSEVLHQLQQRNKWLQPQDNLQKDDLVLIVDELATPSCWPLGRVVDVFPGRDGLIRVATVKTARTILTRPIVKLIRLPIDSKAEDFYCNFVRISKC